MCCTTQVGMEERKNKMGGFYGLDFASQVIVPTSAKKLNKHYISFKRLFFCASRVECTRYVFKTTFPNVPEPTPKIVYAQLLPSVKKKIVTSFPYLSNGRKLIT